MNPETDDKENPNVQMWRFSNKDNQLQINKFDKVYFFFS
jgi:hypothetical protein